MDGINTEMLSLDKINDDFLTLSREPQESLYVLTPQTNPENSNSSMSNQSPEAQYTIISSDPFLFEITENPSVVPHTPENEPQPFLQITEEPQDKFRFRYITERSSKKLGTLMGTSSGTHRKSFPTVTLCNFTGEAIIQCSLYQCEGAAKKMHHSHKLVTTRDGHHINDPHRVTVSESRGYSAAFKGMAIIQTPKKVIAEELYRKLKFQEEIVGIELSYRKEHQLKQQANEASKPMNLNSVCLGFQAFMKDPNGTGLISLCDPVFSRPVNNTHSAATKELKIARLSSVVSSVSGGQELFMFVDKVCKRDIKVRFYELAENGDEIWSDWGIFTELDVHHQFAIALETPPYRNTEIQSSVEVFIELYRPSDKECSEPFPFKYKPLEVLYPRKRSRASEGDLQVLPIQSLSIQASNPTTPHPINNEDLQIINELFPSNISGLTSGDFADLMMLTCDAEKSNPEDQEVPEQKLQIEDVFDKLAKIYRIYKNNPENADSVRENIRTVITEYFEKYGGETSFLQDLLGYGDGTRVRQVIQMLNKFNLEDLLKEIDPFNNSNLLHTVCSKNKPQFIRALVNAGLDPNKQDKNGNSPLHLAVLAGSTSCVQALLQLPLSELFNNEGLSPIHIAVKSRHLPITGLLLQADFNVTSGERKQGNSALHLAVLSKSLKSCEMILERNKFAAQAKNYAGLTPLEMAKEMSSDEKNIDFKTILQKLESIEF